MKIPSFIPITLLSTLLFSAASIAEGAELILVESGKPKTVIVLADKPSLAARIGAAVLAAQLERVSGAKIPIFAERHLQGTTIADDRIRATVQSSSPQTFILIGESSITNRLGVKVENLGPGGILLRTFPNSLVLLGADEKTPSDSNGTRYAVTTFLEEALGFRFLWPGELGLVAPPRKTIRVPDLNKTFTPMITQRRIRNSTYNSRIQVGLDYLDLNKKDYDKLDTVIAGGVELPSWFAWQRLGGDAGLVSGHAYDYTWEKYHHKHPEWFAMQRNGSRDLTKLTPQRARLCTSNLDLIDALAADKIAELDRSGKGSISLSPSDGGKATFCMCAECKKLDPAEGRVTQLWDYNLQQPEYFDYVSLTDRMVWFWNQLATRITAKHPDAWLTLYAYSAYHAPPIREKLHPNLAVGFVQMNYRKETARLQARKDWNAWAMTAKKLYWRPNLLLFARREGTPALYAHKLGEDLSYFAHHSLIGTDFDACMHHWSTEGLNYYVLARLLWNPDKSVDAILNDYSQTGFGKGWRDVRRYLAKIEQLTNGIAEKESSVTSPYTPTVIAELRGMLDSADKAAAGDKIVRRRIVFLRWGLEFTSLQNRTHNYHARHIVKTLSEAEQRELLELQQEKWLLMRRIFREDPLAVNVAMVAWGSEGDFRKLRWNGAKSVPNSVITADEEGRPEGK
ncbi:MAG: DUF4838 domain-containing protein [Verrucomicrobiota bacterium]